MNPLTEGPVHQMYRPKTLPTVKVKIAIFTNPEPVSPHFIPPEKHFKRDFDGEERMCTEQRQQIKKQLRNQCCQLMLQRDAQRMVINVMRDYGKWKRNGSKVEEQYILLYNPITLEHEDRDYGRMLRAQDEEKYDREVQRLDNLDAKRNSECNLLTVESRPAPIPPRKHF